MKEVLRSSKGQVALVVLLVSALMLTLGLSVSKQTTTEIKIDTDEELLKQAFNAAESGVDYNLSTGENVFYSPDLKSKAEITVANIGETSVLNSDGMVNSNDSFSFWLVNHDSSENIGTVYYSGVGVTICVDSTFNKAIKVDYFYLKSGQYIVSHSGYNFDSDVGKTVTGFQDKVGKGGCVGLSMGTGNSPLLLVVTPIGGQTSLSLRGTSNFPIQGRKITSVGKAGDVSAVAGGSVNTKVSVIDRYELPAFMLETITSGGGVN